MVERIMLMTAAKMQEIGGGDGDVNKRRVNPENYPIRLSAGGGVCAKFTVVYGQSRVVCVEWLPISFGNSVRWTISSRATSLFLHAPSTTISI